MSRKVLRTLRTIRTQVRKYKDTLNHYENLFKEDGTISTEEQQQLNTLNKAIQQIEDNILEGEQELKLGGKIINKINKAVEGVGDFLNKNDDVVDSSLIEQGNSTR